MSITAVMAGASSPRCHEGEGRGMGLGWGWVTGVGLGKKYTLYVYTK